MERLKETGRILLSAFLLAASGAFLSAESFRVGRTNLVSVELESASETSVSMGINEALAISLPEDKTFLEGIEIKLAIPEEIAQWRDSVACLVYSGIRPRPTATQIDYSGTRFYVSTLPGKLSWLLQIPFAKNHSMKANQYTAVTEALSDISGNFIFVRLQSVMKGIPEDALNARLVLTVKPVLLDKGRLHLTLKSTEKRLQQCTVFIDGESYETDGGILLPSGVHNISILSEAYRSEFRTVRIEQAKTTSLEIIMKSLEPTLMVTAPEGTEVYLDNKPCKTFGSEFAISEGEHRIKVNIGDYEITRSITAVKGKTYTANFAVDLQISEE